MKKLKAFGLVVLGFALYPLLFVPICVKFCPGLLEWWLYVYSDYLKLWGF